MSDVDRGADVRVPLMIGAIGHRDLVSGEVERLRERVFGLDAA
jgi:hypothetical protein